MPRRQPSRRPRPSRRPAASATSRARILAAAAEEFAARGFDGAKVDRIAARARVNKALLYYYFRHKAALHREILRELFAAVATAVEAVRGSEAPPDVRLHAFIQIVADETVRRPLFPATWLREMAEGGRHVDESIVAEMRRVLEVLAGILRAGRATGQFVEVNPFVVQMGVVAPLLIFAATGPVRERFRHLMPPGLVDIPRQQVVDHVRLATLAALQVPASSAHSHSPTDSGRFSR